MDQISRRTHASESNVYQERPLSWHPTSYEQPVDFSQYSQTNFFPQFDFSANPFTTTEINGLITPMSAPVPNEPQIQELMTPLEDYSPHEYPNLSFGNDYVSKVGTYYLPEQDYPAQGLTYEPEQVPYEYQQSMPQMYQMQPANYSHLNVDTAPPSPSLLPIQNFDNDRATSPFALGSPRVEKEELVGMGLYDKPQDVQSSTLPSAGPTTMAALTAGIGKGLKLEESFEPPPATEEDDEKEDETEEQEEPEDLTASPTTMIGNVLPPSGYVDDPSNLDAQTFFFDDKEAQYPMSTAENISYPYYPHWDSANNQSYNWI